MKKFTQIKVEKVRPIEFLFASDLESELHPGEDPRLGVHTGEVLEEMLKEARCQGHYSHLPPPHFILSNGDEDSRFDKRYESVWRELENLPCPCYHVFGNHESVTFGRKEGNTLNYYLHNDDWRRYFDYEDTCYAWEYLFKDKRTMVTFVVLDTWCLEKDENGGRMCKEGSGNQVLREEQKEWLKKMLDRTPGLIVVFAHTHTWPPNYRPQDNEAMEELVDILKGTYEDGVVHNHANVFFNGGHHDYPDCNRVNGVYFVDPIGAIHTGYARVIIDPINKKMDYIGRFDEKSYRNLDLS